MTCQQYSWTSSSKQLPLMASDRDSQNALSLLALSREQGMVRAIRQVHNAVQPRGMHAEGSRQHESCTQGDYWRLCCPGKCCWRGQLRFPVPHPAVLKACSPSHQSTAHSLTTAGLRPLSQGHCAGQLCWRVGQTSVPSAVCPVGQQCGAQL